MPTDRLVDLTLRIVNEGSKSLNYDEVQVSGGRIQAKLEQTVIDQGKGGICRLTIETTPKQRGQAIHVPIRLLNSEAPHEHFVIVIKWYLQGYLGFLEPYITRELTEGQRMTEVVVPFAATAPVVGDLVAVSENSIIAAHRIEAVTEEKDIWNLCLSVRNSDVPKEGMAIAKACDQWRNRLSVNEWCSTRNKGSVCTQKFLR